LAWTYSFRLICQSRNAIKAIGAASQSPRLDAQVLLSHTLGVSRSWLLAHPESPLTASQHKAYWEAVQRRSGGEPLPYILGQWEFYGLEFTVTPAVLIPRPETELLVETALEWLQRNPEKRRLADIGTGSGCIAIALAAHVPDLQVFASDISIHALQVARQNIARNALAERIHLTQADLLSPYPLSPGSAGSALRFDLICANLPYIPADMLQTLAVGQWEPQAALDGGRDGLAHIHRLLADSRSRITPGGILLLEIEATLGDAAQRLVQELLPEAKQRLLPDYAGLDRLLVIESPPSAEQLAN